MRADVTNEDDVAAMVARAVDEFGQVDIMCNNAAAPGTDLWIWEQTLENWNATIAIDVTAAMLCTREVLRQSMLERRSGVILNFSSTAGYSGMVRKSHYVTAKASLRAFTKAVALEVGQYGIRCNCIVPGQHRHRTVAELGASAWPTSRASTTRPTGPASCRAWRCATSPRPRTSPTWRCSWPATRAGPSPGSRSPSTPAATCRAEEAPMTVKLSIGTPVVTMTPGRHGQWEAAGTIDDLARIAETADRLGYHHLTCSEHIALPAAELARRGARYWDPLATFGYLAARTQRIRFATNVLVLAYHHPLEIAKRYGTLDVVSNGRVILGVGVGTLQGGVRPPRRPLRRPRPTRRRRPAGPSRVAVASPNPPTTATSTTSRASSSIPARSRSTSRSGSAGAPCARSAGRSRSPTAGAPSR